MQFKITIFKDELHLYFLNISRAYICILKLLEKQVNEILLRINYLVMQFY